MSDHQVDSIASGDDARPQRFMASGQCVTHRSRRPALLGLDTSSPPVSRPRKLLQRVQQGQQIAEQRPASRHRFPARSVIGNLAVEVGGGAIIWN